MPDDVKPHEISLAIWDFASPVVVSRQSKIKVGGNCSGGCLLAGQEIEIHNEADVTVASAKLGAAPWLGTSALYWAELDFVAPAAEGTYSWNVSLTASNLELPHARASSQFSFIAVPPPEHSVTVKVIDKSTETPVDDVQVRLGVYRGCTDESGFANVELRKGIYDLVVFKVGYEPLTKPLEVNSDVTVQVEIEVAVEPEQEYWMG
jgi:hypothetical protein